MKSKRLLTAITTLTLATVMGVGIIINHAQATEQTILQDVTAAGPVPFEVQQRQDHPDAIVTKDVRYDKNNETKQVFKTNEIVYDAQQTNETTKVIIQNGDIFIKQNSQ